MRLAGLYSERVVGTFDDLLGAGRYAKHRGTGYVLLGLPGFAAPPWTPPQDGWHIDGVHFHHHVNSCEQGLIGLYLYTDIEHGGGGTVVRPGSHRITARILNEAEPEGLAHHELSRRVAEQVQDLPVREVIGNAGDMVVMHPHLYHGSSDNVHERIRIASNMCIGLHEPMNLHRANKAEYSPVELAIVNALSF
ncbi:MAG: phytanoyl-CoA dioxygenase family protein [Abitibacteriaceae bacterium]|nr:phytanoyl-CoA dioxygenase family protein [Abditibacteriaceae bacterium]